MKSKKYVLVFIVTTLLCFSIPMDFGIADNPKTQANGGFSLGYEIGDYFEFYCTEMDSTELNNVFGAGWVTDLSSYFWFTSNNAPSNIGEKTRFLVEDITNTSTIWQFQMDGWDWTPKTSTYGAPVQNDIIYNLPLNASAAIFNPTVWLLALPVEDYITEMSLPGGFTSSGNEIFYNSTDVDDYQIGWIYDEETGVVKNWWIKNGVGDTIFEMWGFTLKIQADASYNWIVTTFNQGQLSSVFGVNWENDINAYCWWALDAPILNGEKSMFYIDTLGNHPSIDDWYYMDVDGWNWKPKALLHGGVPDRDDAPYNLPMDPEGVSFSYTLFMIPTPVIMYLDLLSYTAGYSHDGNEVSRTTSDDEEYTVEWVYDEGLGVVDSFLIKNSAGSTIFQIILMEFKFEPETTFEWEVTKLDNAGLEDVLGVDWETNIQSYFGGDCNETGVKMKRSFNSVNLVTNLWYVDYSQWYWTKDSYAIDPNFTSSYSVFCNPEDGLWGSWMWLVPFPSEYYLLGRGYGGNTKLEYLTVTQNATDVQDFQFLYTYDLLLGVYSRAQLINNESTVLFEYQLVSVEDPPGGGLISGFDTFFVISSVFLMIGLISLISIRRRKIKN